jgi:hypothetical protein
MRMRERIDTATNAFSRVYAYTRLRLYPSFFRIRIEELIAKAVLERSNRLLSLF